MVSLRHPLSCIFVILFGISCISKENHSDVSSEIPKEEFKIKNAWVRPAQKGMISGAYLTILNGTDQADTLIGISSEAAGKAEIHLSIEKNGISEMHPAGNLPIEANSRLKLEPSGYHIMLMQLQHKLTAGDSIPATLYFSGTGSMTIHIPVQ